MSNFSILNIKAQRDEGGRGVWLSKLTSNIQQNILPENNIDIKSRYE